MGKIWPAAIVLSIVCAILTGRAGAAADEILGSGGAAVELMLTLLGTMTLWSGLMEILAETGDLERLGRLFRRVARPLFPGLEDEKSWSAMSMNLAANLLGLGNAATPAGIEAAKRLAGQGETGMKALAMLLVLNNSGVQLIPTTVIALRQAAGSADPACIWLPTLAASLTAALTGAAMMALIQRRRRKAWQA